MFQTSLLIPFQRVLLSVEAHSEKRDFWLTAESLGQSSPTHPSTPAVLYHLCGGAIVPLCRRTNLLNCFRPIAAYGALDIPTYPIDLTPFVPLLTDGNEHEFTIDVVSAEGNHTTLDNWFVSGVLQVLVDPNSNDPTTGSMTTYEAEEFADTETIGSSSGEGELDFTVTASRKIHIESEFTSGSGQTTTAIWTQALQFSSHQTISDNATIQVCFGLF